MSMSRSIDRNQIQFDFAIESASKGLFEDEARSLGAIIHRLGKRNRPGFRQRLKRCLRHRGGYRIVHSHHNHYSGYLMRLARSCGVPVRITHSHTDSSRRDRRGSWGRRMLVAQSHRWIQHFATLGLAASEPAADSLFGPHWRRDGRFRIMHCSIDFEPFCRVGNPGVRQRLGIRKDAWVIGQVGRLADVKNHRFTLENFATIHQRVPNACLLIVGDGQQRESLISLAQALECSDRTFFIGNRSDVPDLLLNAMDAYVMPSHAEGLPLALLEAQAAGLPCIVSDVIAREAAVLPDQVQFRSIQESWVDALLALRAQPRRRYAVTTMMQTDFSLPIGTQALQQIYQDSLAIAWNAESRSAVPTETQTNNQPTRINPPIVNRPFPKVPAMPSWVSSVKR